MGCWGRRKEIERMSLLKFLYALSIALLVLACAVFGISAFPRPEPPSYPPELQSLGQNPTEEQQALLAEQQQKEQAFQQQVFVYNGVASLIAIGAGVVLLVGSILWLSGLVVIGNGVTLGAVLTLLYGLYFAYHSSGTVGLARFVLVAVGLVILLSVVYWRLERSKGDTEGIRKVQGRPPNPKQEEREPVGINRTEE
jgi:uncharacterized membrane protein SpoIIM required for sporulation